MKKTSLQKRPPGRPPTKNKSIQKNVRFKKDGTITKSLKRVPIKEVERYLLTNANFYTCKPGRPPTGQKSLLRAAAIHFDITDRTVRRIAQKLTKSHQAKAAMAPMTSEQAALVAALVGQYSNRKDIIRIHNKNKIRTLNITSTKIHPSNDIHHNAKVEKPAYLEPYTTTKAWAIIAEVLEKSSDTNALEQMRQILVKRLPSPSPQGRGLDAIGLKTADAVSLQPSSISKDTNTIICESLMESIEAYLASSCQRGPDMERVLLSVKTRIQSELRDK